MIFRCSPNLLFPVYWWSWKSFVFPFLQKVSLYLLPIFLVGDYLSIFIHGNSVCIKDANCWWLAQFLRRLQSSCWSSLQSSQGFIWTWRVYFQDRSHDCWQVSGLCHVDIFIGMLRTWHLLPSVRYPRKKIQARGHIFL